MGAGEEKVFDEESREALLGQPATAAAADGVSTREWVTRWLLIVALLTNFYTWRHFTSLSCEGVEVRQLKGKENWAHRAAYVAESLAAVDCSGHGTVFMDTLQTGPGEVVCECHACYTGSTCAEYTPDCTASIERGDPVMYEAFWKQNAEMGTLVIPPWYRLSYSEGMDSRTLGTPGLESQIRALHALVGNAVIEDKTILVSAGSSQMLFAIAQALSNDYPGKTSLVSATPFYGLYKAQADNFGNNKFAWGGDVETFGSTVGKNVLEYVTTPNNPTFGVRRPVLNGSQPIFDFAYYWPSMSPINHAYDEDIMIFTFSKVGGHAGTRLGWAFFRDPELAMKVKTLLGINSLGNPRDSQARAFQILKGINTVYSKDNGPVPMGLSAARYAAEGRVFHYGRAVLQERYQWLQGIIARSSRFSVLKLEAEYCAYFGQKLTSSPAYAWVYCNRDEDDDCYNLFLSSGISTDPGVKYGVSNRFVRFSMFKRDSDYQLVEKYLSVLVAG